MGVGLGIWGDDMNKDEIREYHRKNDKKYYEKNKCKKI